MASGSSWITTAPSSMDRRGSKIAGRISYSTAIFSRASRAASGEVAATAATLSPTKRTFLSRQNES